MTHVVFNAFLFSAVCMFTLLLPWRHKVYIFTRQSNVCCDWLLLLWRATGMQVNSYLMQRRIVVKSTLTCLIWTIRLPVVS